MARRQPSESFSDWLSRALEDTALADLQVPLQNLLQLHYRHRFDPPGLNPDERETLKCEVKICLDALLNIRKRETPALDPRGELKDDGTAKIDGGALVSTM